MVKWTQKQASATIDSSLQKMVSLLKLKVVESKLQSGQFSKEDFIALVEEEKVKTKHLIQEKFYKEDGE